MVTYCMAHPIPSLIDWRCQNFAITSNLLAQNGER